AGGASRCARPLVRHRGAGAPRSSRGERADLRAAAGACDAEGLATTARLDLARGRRRVPGGARVRADAGAAPPRAHRPSRTAEGAALHAQAEEAAPAAPARADRLQPRDLTVPAYPNTARASR